MPRIFQKMNGRSTHYLLLAPLFTLVLSLLPSIWNEAGAIRLVGGEPKSYIYTAETVETVKRTGLVKAGGHIWDCRGKLCATEMKSGTPEIKGCRALVKKVGGLESYGHEEAVLSPGALGRCNAGLYAAGMEAMQQEVGNPSARSTSLNELKKSIGKCSKQERPQIRFSAYPDIPEAWPKQYIQLSWSVSDYMGRSWPHKVYLRRDEASGPGSGAGEEVAPIWTTRLKVADMAEGENPFYIVTRCGIAVVTIKKAVQPLIESSTTYILRGKEIRIRGKNFRDRDPAAFRKVMVVEPGHTREINVVSWSDTEIVAHIQDDVLPGRRELFVDSGLDRGHRRASNRMPLVVVKQERFPSINIIKVLEDLFVDAQIHINNRGSRIKGSTIKENDAYVSLGEKMGGGRVYLDILEYALDLGPDPDDPSQPRSVRYYVNDINMDAVRVSERGEGFEMTLYFENLHPEFQGDLLLENEFGPPPDIHIDNLRVLIHFDLVAEDGLITVKVSGVDVEGDFRGSGPFCGYGPLNVCSELYPRYISDIRDQLRDAVEEILSSDYNRSSIGGAIKPWLRYNGLTEVTNVKLDGKELVIDYIP